MNELKPAERVIHLLRTVDDARVAWDEKTSGGGTFLMPTMWNEGSYAELERCLQLMREGGEDYLLDPSTGKAAFSTGAFPVSVLRPPERRLWFHVTMRYRYGEIRTIQARVRRTLKGPKPVLPPYCEEVAGSAVIGGSTALVRVYRWSHTVDEDAAARGLVRLTELMHGGMTQRIMLPVSVMRRALGLPDVKDVAGEVVAA